MTSPTERPGRSQLKAEARVAVELDQPVIISAEHGGTIFTDDVLIIFRRQIVNLDAGDDEADSGWVPEARVQGNRLAKRPNPDGSPKRLRSYGQATYLEGRDVFPQWLSELTEKYNPEKIG